MLFLGLDVGTVGVRVVVASDSGEVPVAVARPMKGDELPPLPKGWSEQEPRFWWETAKACLRETVEKLGRKGFAATSIRALAVTSTSGTVLPIDAGGNPLRRALMYNDCRAGRESERLNVVGKELTAKLGYQFQPSFSLCKILWIKENEPRVYEKAHKFLHAADFLVGKLTGDFGLSDSSNAMKTGYDLVDSKWPSFIAGELGIGRALLPEVVRPGEVMGKVSETASRETGLSAGTEVVAGATDSTAALFASGASRPGDANSTLGTTLAVKAISEKIVRDGRGRVYCHAHPQGWWIAGGASSVGAECLTKKFPGEDLAAMDRLAMAIIPTGLIIYPLVRTGERMPFVNPLAEGFVIGQARDGAELYAGYLEAVAFVERWSFDVLEELGVRVDEKIYVMGGATASREWLTIRATVLDRTLIEPMASETAMGAAILAASRAFYGNVSEAVAGMVREKSATRPRKDLVDSYRRKYAEFREACRLRGYE